MNQISKRIADLVEKIADCYEIPNEEIVKDFNQLTGLNWEAEKYFNYCCEYWSHNSLEETVYALLHNGEYPDKTELEICFWKEKKSIDLSDEDIWMHFELGKEKEICDKFEKLPIEEILIWFREKFNNWILYEEDETDIQPEEEDLSCYIFIPRIEDEEMEQQILFNSYSRCVLNICFENVNENEIQEIVEYLKERGLYIYYCS